MHPVLVTIYLFDILERSNAPSTGDDLPVWYSGMYNCTLYWWQFTSLIFWNCRLHPLLVMIYLFDKFDWTLYWWQFTCLIFWNIRLHPLLVTIYLFDILECSTVLSTGDDLPVWYFGMVDCTLYWWQFTCLIFWNVQLHPLLVTIYLFDILECSTAPSTGDNLNLPVWYVWLHPLLVTIYLFDILECSIAPSTGDDLPVWYSGMFDCTLYRWQFKFTCLICLTAPSTGDNLPVWYSGMFNCTLYWWRFTCLIFWNVRLHPLLVTIYLFDILEHSTAPSTGDNLPLWYSGMFNCTVYWWRFTCLIFWNGLLHPLLVTIYLFDILECSIAPSTGDDLPVWYSGMFDCTLY